MAVRKAGVRRGVLLSGVGIGALFAASGAAANSAAEADGGASAAACATAEVASCTVGARVIYQPPFFTQYNPVTALDMVSRVPGFSIDAGDDVRGFSGAAGNVLIDGQRPSTKSTDIYQTLSRIGADSVERLELIRGGTGGLDVGGQAVVVNVVRKAGASGGNESLWEFRLLKRRPHGHVRPSGEVTFTGKRGAIDYTIGANAYGFGLRFDGNEQITRYFGDDEQRFREGVYHEQGGGGNFNLEREMGNGDTARLNGEIFLSRSREDFDETRLLAVGGPDLARFTFPFRYFNYEVGGDYEHAFTDNFDAKLIGLYNQSTRKFESGFEFLPATGPGDQSLFISDQTSGETIGRLEMDWKGWKRHTIQFGGEFARNYIDSKAELFVSDGMGALTPVTIDGANTRVVELRGEPFMTDSWRPAEKLTIDFGMAVEFSSIAQTGDSANSRFFTYPKPSLTLTYSAGEKLQYRLSAKREVNQLSFGQFVSSVNFDDEDVDFGNPELRPQREWKFEATAEKRFGDIGVIELTGFYSAVQDVEDLLPIGGIVEVPGNIGDGQIYGATLNVTTPLGWLLLKNARLESEFTLRDSNVADPVTGVTRDFSYTPDMSYEIEFRQDFPKKKVSWGWYMGRSAKERGYGLDEIAVFRNQLEMNTFIETTMIKGVKARFEVNDIINAAGERDRTVFDGSRAAGAPLFREVRKSYNGGGLRLILSGSF